MLESSQSFRAACGAFAAAIMLLLGVSPSAFGFRDAFVNSVRNETIARDPCFTLGVPNENVVSEECETRESPPQHHNWEEGEVENHGVEVAYLVIVVTGASEVERGKWQSPNPRLPKSWDDGEYGMWANVGEAGKYWPLLGWIGQKNSRGYRQNIWGWFYGK